MVNLHVPIAPALSMAGSPEGVASFDALYSTHVDDVARWMSHFVGPGHEIEDLVHDVFRIAFEKWPQFRGEAKPRTWLYGIALNVARNHRRWRRLRRFLPFDEQRAPTVEVGPDRALEQQRSVRLVHRVLDRLGEKDRSILIMFELQELSGAEIAEVLGIQVNAVWVRLHRARQAFVKVMAQVQPEEQR